MAESGLKSPLDAEVSGAIAAGTAQHLLSGGNLAVSPASVSLEFTIIALDPYDAGTDSGTTYGAADIVTRPFQPIARIQGSPLLHQGRVSPMGTFTFRRIE